MRVCVGVGVGVHGCGCAWVCVLCVVLWVGRWVFVHVVVLYLIFRNCPKL